MTKQHRLTCHCGAVELAIDAELDLSEASRCDCSFCARRGAIAVRVPLSSVRIMQGEDAITLYQWNTHAAKHHFCKHCGIYTHHQTRANPKLMGLNAAAIDGVDVLELGVVPWTEGRNHPSDA